MTMQAQPPYSRHARDKIFTALRADLLCGLTWTCSQKRDLQKDSPSQEILSRAWKQLQMLGINSGPIRTWLNHQFPENALRPLGPKEDYFLPKDLTEAILQSPDSFDNLADILLNGGYSLDPLPLYTDPELAKSRFARFLDIPRIDVEVEEATPSAYYHHEFELSELPEDTQRYDITFAQGSILQPQFFENERARSQKVSTIAVDMDGMIGTSTDHYRSFHLRSGIEAALKKLKDAGVRLVLWTSAKRENVLSVLKLHPSLISYFDLVITAENYDISQSDWIRWSKAYPRINQETLTEFFSLFSRPLNWKDISFLGYRLLVEDNTIYKNVLSPFPFGPAMAHWVPTVDGSDNHQSENLADTLLQRLNLDYIERRSKLEGTLQEVMSSSSWISLQRTLRVEQSTVDQGWGVKIDQAVHPKAYIHMRLTRPFESNINGSYNNPLLQGFCQMFHFALNDYFERSGLQLSAARLLQVEKDPISDQLISDQKELITGFYVRINDSPSLSHEKASFTSLPLQVF